MNDTDYCEEISVDDFNSLGRYSLYECPVNSNNSHKTVDEVLFHVYDNRSRNSIYVDARMCDCGAIVSYKVRQEFLGFDHFTCYHKRVSKNE